MFYLAVKIKAINASKFPSDLFIVKCEQILHNVLVFPFLTLNK